MQRWTLSPELEALIDAIPDDDDDLPPKPKPRKAEIVLRYERFIDVKEKLVQWVWPHRIPRGKFSLFTGVPDCGKTTTAIDESARITVAGEWPDGSGRAELGSVIYISAEDDVADTLRPRAEVAGADLKRLIRICMPSDDDGNVIPFSLQDHLGALATLVRRLGDVVQIVIDPITAYLGAGRIDTHKTSDVRALLSPVKDFAERENVALLGITHPGKNVTTAMNAVTGSLAFIAAARAAWLFVPEITDGQESGRMLMLRIKNNLACRNGGLAYRLNHGTTPLGNEVPWLAWDRLPVNLSADAALATLGELTAIKSNGATGSAVQFIIDEIEAAGGRILSQDIEAAARKASISVGTLRLAKDKLQVVSEREGFGKDGKWYWSLPKALHRCGLPPD